MFSVRIISKVKDELNKLNIECNEEIMLSKLDKNIITLRMFKDDKAYVIKYYEGKDRERYISNYKVMENIGINNPMFLAFSDKLVIYEDVTQNLSFKSVCENDLKDERVIISLAKFYKRLHQFKCEKCFNYLEYFSYGNLVKMTNKLNLKNNETLAFIRNNFDNIKLKLDRVNLCLNFECFSLDALRISEDFKEIVFTDFDNVCLGYSYRDIHSLLNAFGNKEREIFLNEYGSINEDEKIAYLAIEDIIKLYIASKEEVFPVWANEAINNLSGGKTLENVKSLVNWY